MGSHSSRWDRTPKRRPQSQLSTGKNSTVVHSRSTKPGPAKIAAVVVAAAVVDVSTGLAAIRVMIAAVVAVADAVVLVAIFGDSLPPGDCILTFVLVRRLIETPGQFFICS